MKSKVSCFMKIMCFTKIVIAENVKITLGRLLMSNNIFALRKSMKVPLKIN